MTIQIVAPGEYISTSDQQPEVGRSYLLEDATNGTLAQNNTFHALLTAYWVSGQHSYNAKNFEDFRNQIKRSLGAGFEAFVYVKIVDGQPVILNASSIEEIPLEIRRDPDYRKMIRGRLKSWADYTKKQRIATIDRLIAEMRQAGVNTKKFDEIMRGLEENKCDR